MTPKNAVSQLQRLAVEKGANSTKLIAVEDISVEDWVRQKCEYGCTGYARHFTCPPYSPTPEETRKRLQGYRQALLVEFTRMGEKEDQSAVYQVMYELERAAFLSGFYKAFSYSSGPCRICRSCKAEEVRSPSEYSKRECRDKKRARPSMEACGIDVYQTARKAGYKIDVVKEEGDFFHTFGLLLIK